MKNKAVVIIFLGIILIFLFTACNSEYSSLVMKYNQLFDETINMLDTENLSESIANNNLASNVEQLDNLLDEIGKVVPKSKSTEFMQLGMKQNSIEEIIDKGLKWNSLDGLEKLSIQQGIKTLKTE